MKYAIEVLEKEIHLIERCLSDLGWDNYPEAKKERDERLKGLIKAVKQLKSNSNNGNISNNNFCK